jgi:hypothetical protein
MAISGAAAGREAQSRADRRTSRWAFGEVQSAEEIGFAKSLPRDV